MASRHAGNRNAGCLNSQDLVYSVILENAVKLLADFIQQVNIQLVVQKQSTFSTLPGRTCPSRRMRSSKSFILRYPFHVYQLLCLIPPRFSTLKTRFFIFYYKLCQYGSLIIFCNQTLCKTATKALDSICNLCRYSVLKICQLGGIL